jgi:hypothetical protein
VSIKIKNGPAGIQLNILPRHELAPPRLRNEAPVRGAKLFEDLFPARAFKVLQVGIHEELKAGAAAAGAGAAA